MSLRLKLFQFALPAALLLPPVASALPYYTIHIVAPAGSSASDINQTGQVVGQYVNGNGERRAFVNAGDMTDLGTLGGATATAAAINNHGQVVGTASDAAGEDRAFSYENGVMHDLGTFGGATSAAYGINDAGRIVGSATTAFGYGENGLAFVQISGVKYNLGAFPTVDYAVRSSARAINTAGRVVGVSSIGDFGAPEYPEHAFMADNGLMVDLGTLGGLYSEAFSINDGGWIAGRASTTLDPDNVGHTIPHGFLYINGLMIDLGGLSGPLDFSEARDVNNLGQVVGFSSVANAPDNHGFLFQGGSMLDLNALIDPLSGWTVTGASAINDLQQIAGTACHNGQCFAVRLDLPEPGTWLLTGLGLGVLGWSARLTRRSTQS